MIGIAIAESPLLLSICGHVCLILLTHILLLISRLWPDAVLVIVFVVGTIRATATVIGVVRLLRLVRVVVVGVVVGTIISASLLLVGIGMPRKLRPSSASTRMMRSVAMIRSVAMARVIRPI